MPRPERRVAVTGIGQISAAGNDLDTFWDKLVSGRSCIGEITLTPVERFNCRNVAEIKDFQPEKHFDRRQISMTDRFSQLAIAASRAALVDSGLSLDDENRDRIAVILGTGAGGLHTLDDSFLSLYGHNAQRFPPLTIPRLMVSAAASQVSMDLGLRGESFAVASACASATHAIGLAYRAIMAGDAEIAFTGGTESCLTVGTIKAWEALRVMSAEPCRPFSSDRNGMTLGEGAATLVLEDFEHARRRGARIYGYVSGFGCSADAADLVAPSAEGAAKALTNALLSARVSPEAVDYVNAHGTGTTANDMNEAKALRLALGAAASKVMVNSSKSVFGHCLGAAGALEAVTTLLSIHKGVVHPTANVVNVDPTLDLDVVIGTARDANIQIALSNSFAFGGLNAVLVFEKA